MEIMERVVPVRDRDKGCCHASGEDVKQTINP